MLLPQGKLCFLTETTEPGVAQLSLSPHMPFRTGLICLFLNYQAYAPEEKPGEMERCTGVQLQAPLLKSCLPQKVEANQQWDSPWMPLALSSQVTRSGWQELLAQLLTYCSHPVPMNPRGQPHLTKPRWGLPEQVPPFLQGSDRQAFPRLSHNQSPQLAGHRHTKLPNVLQQLALFPQGLSKHSSLSSSLRFSSKPANGARGNPFRGAWRKHCLYP